MGKVIMHSDCILRFTPETIHSLSHPLGVARVVAGEALQAREMALLSYFREHAGRTLSREELAERVWKQRYFHASRAIDQTVSKLRKKLRTGEGRILSVWSEGYRFECGEAPEQERTYLQRDAQAA